jgi:hypothetical protein
VCLLLPVSLCCGHTPVCLRLLLCRQPLAALTFASRAL